MPEVPHVKHLMLIDSRNDVAVLKPAHSSRLGCVDLKRQHTPVTFEAEAGHHAWRNGDWCEPQIGTVNRPSNYHRLDVRADRFHGKCITDGLRRRGDDDIDANNATRKINQRAPAVTWIDGGIGLNQIVERFTIGSQD